MSNTPMLDNLLAACSAPEPSPLYGLPYNEGVGGVTIGTHKVGEIVLLREPMTQQFAATVAAGCYYAIVDANEAPLGILMETITQAHGYGLAAIVKNPLRKSGPVQVMAHNNTAGILVEADDAYPLALNTFRRDARRDGLLPIWFVFNADQETVATDVADQIRRSNLTGMEVVIRS